MVFVLVDFVIDVGVDLVWPNSWWVELECIETKFLSQPSRVVLDWGIGGHDFCRDGYAVEEPWDH